MSHKGYAREDAPPSASAATKWVLTMPTSDGLTIHVEVASKDQGLDLVSFVRAKAGVDQTYSLEEVPATWECRGEDGCTVVS